MSDVTISVAEIQLAVDCSQTLNFAMQQNDVPFIRQIEVTNNGDDSISDLRVRLTSEPEMFPAWETVVASILPGGTYRISPVDVRLAPDLLAGLTERVAGVLHAAVICDGQTVASQDVSMVMLAFDEWNGLAYSLPELLAAFVLPNHPRIEAILATAAKWLGAETGNHSLSGYQTRSPSRVAQVTQAVYYALRSQGITYCNPPASFETTGQKVRLPDRIFENRLATCLDLALLTAACLEQAGLNPLAIFTAEHAFTGVWLVDETFPDSGIDDVLRLTKRIELNEILVFETVLVTSPPPNDFAAAVEAGKRHLNDRDKFHCMVDIRRCRKSRVLPLPVNRRGLITPEAAVEAIEATPSRESLFELGDVLVPQQPPKVETAATRLDGWKRKLLDLTLRNRLLNFRETKKTVPLLCPNLSSLEDSLADGLEFQIHARSSEFDGRGLRDASLHQIRTGENPVDAFLQSELNSRRLHANVTEQDLRLRLTELYRTARTAMEEGGASSLYLALGFLAWYESDSSQQRRLAPIILLPVELHRNSIQEGVRFKQSDEDARINITLLEMLVKDFGLHVPDMEPIPEDEHGIDVTGILNTFRTAIKNTNRWEVVEQAQLGLFSFTKFLMWRDLEQRSEELLHSQVVDHLVNHATEPYPDRDGFPDEERLDDEYPPDQTFCPLPSDASQLAAVYAAAMPKSFVLFGPPGTGKSQTITNLITQSLANNKSVLFVSEKMAALNVVHHRLTQCGLGPFCLELHSNKTHKRHVVDQLGHALDFQGQQSSGEWAREAARLATLRADLNAYVRALHKPRSFGQSIFQATSRLIGLWSTKPIDLKLESCESITREQLDRWHDLIDQLRVAGEACGHPGSSPWTGCAIESLSPTTVKAVETEIHNLIAACERIEEMARKLSRPLGLPTSWNLSYLDFVEKFVEFLLTSPRPTAALLVEDNWEYATGSINSWLNHGRSRDALRQTVCARYSEGILTLDLQEISAKLNHARNRWFLPRWLGLRAVRKALAGVLKNREKRTVEDLENDLKTGQSLQAEEKALQACGERAQTLLGQHWKEGEPDWDAIEQLREWGTRFRKFAQTVAGANVRTASVLRKHWSHLLTDNADAVQPSGVFGAAFNEFLQACAEFRQIKQRIEGLLVCSTTAWGGEPMRVTPSDMKAKLNAWLSGMQQLRAWCNWRRVRREANEAGLSALIVAYEEAGLPNSTLRQVFDRSFYQWWAEESIQNEPVLSQFFSPEFQRKITEFRAIDERYMELTQREVQARLLARRPNAPERVSQNSETGILRRQQRLRRGHMPVRRLFQKIPKLLPQLKPCVLMSPISVAQYLDPSHPTFDLVVFDEASQVPIWDAIGAIARGKEVIIVGDPKQLPPTSFFTRADNLEIDDEEFGEEMQSILDECLASQLPQMHLRWHYRSRHESLIAFSNYSYYDNNLLTFPSPHLNQGVSYRHVPSGVYDKGASRTNRGEAEAVVAEIVRRLQDSESAGASIGVVTFSIAQQGLIEDLLEVERRQHPEIEPYFSEDADEAVFVKNLENVQGDERDVIMLSVCYGPDASGKVSMNFGPLNRDGGERRLNVAITRARQEVLVFATLRAEQIDLSRTRARGAQDLKTFLDYADRGPVAISQALSLEGGVEFESPFEKAVCDRLRADGHVVHTQVGCSGYRIDLAIVDPDMPGRYLLGIECDGANYHRAKVARDRDRLRQGVLEGLGWRLHRVWSSDWWENPEACVEKIEAAIEQAKRPPQETVAVPKVAASPELLAENTVERVPSPPPAQETASNGNGLPQYQAYRLPRAAGQPHEFYEVDADRKIRRLINEVVAAEGPVAFDVVCRRVAECWGLRRIGSTIRERMFKLTNQPSIFWVPQGKTLFLWPQGLDPEKYDEFRLPGVHPDESRDIGDVPFQEIVAAGVYVLKQQVSLPMSDFIREISLLFGFARTGRTIQQTISQALEAAFEKQRICEVDGRVCLPRA